MADPLALLPLEYKQTHAALLPPPGVESNFDHPVSRGPTVIAVGAILFALMVIFLAIRFYVRLVVARKTTWGDVTITFAALGATAYFINQIIAVSSGSLGKHLWDVRISDLNRTFFITNAYLSVILTLPTLLAAKLTLLSIYDEIFHPISWMRIGIWIGIIVVTLFHIGAGIAQIVATTPHPHQTWAAHTLSHEEYTSQLNSVPYSAVGLVIDVYLLVLPIKPVMELQLPLKQKIAVTVVFLTGLLACLGSSLSLWSRVEDNKTSDTTWASVNVIIFVLVEMNVGVIISCMPSVSKLLRLYLPQVKAFGLSLRSGNFLSGQSSKNILREDNSGYSTRHEGSVDDGLPGIHQQDGMNRTVSEYKVYHKMGDDPEAQIELMRLKSSPSFIRTVQTK